MGQAIESHCHHGGGNGLSFMPDMLIAVMSAASTQGLYRLSGQMFSCTFLSAYILVRKVVLNHERRTVLKRMPSFGAHKRCAELCADKDANIINEVWQGKHMK